MGCDFVMAPCCGKILFHALMTSCVLCCFTLVFAGMSLTSVCVLIILSCTVLVIRPFAVALMLCFVSMFLALSCYCLRLLLCCVMSDVVISGASCGVVSIFLLSCH